MTERSPTSLCVLAEPYLKAYQVRAIETAVEKAGVDVPLVIVNDEPDPDYDPEREAEAVNGGLGLGAARLFADVVSRERAWALLIAEKKLSEELRLRPPRPRQVHVDDVDCLADAAVRRVTPERDGAWYELPDDAVAAVRDACDVAIRYGFGLIRGDVLTAPEHGLLSFHPADIRRYRGLGPPKAYLDDCGVMGVTLQRLNDDIDGGEMVAYAETDVSDCATLWEVYDRLHDLESELLADGVRDLRNPATEPTVPSDLGPYNSITQRRKPSVAGRLLAKNLAGRARQLVS